MEISEICYQVAGGQRVSEPKTFVSFPGLVCGGVGTPETPLASKMFLALRSIESATLAKAKLYQVIHTILNKSIVTCATTPLLRHFGKMASPSRKFNLS